jgi:hypothetical protein
MRCVSDLTEAQYLDFLQVGFPQFMIVLEAGEGMPRQKNSERNRLAPRTTH